MLVSDGDGNRDWVSSPRLPSSWFEHRWGLYPQKPVQKQVTLMGPGAGYIMLSIPPPPR